MGKVRQKRHRVHQGAVKAKDNESAKQTTQDSSVKLSKVAPTQIPSVGLFSKVDIDLNALSKQLPSSDADFDVRSTITSKSMKGLNLSKKEKRKLKREFLTKKIDQIKLMRQQAKDHKKRQKTAIVGDMRPLVDTLPTLELLLKDCSKVQQPSETKPKKEKAIQKTKTKQKQMNTEISLFRQVLEHPSYKANPLSTITEHLQNKLKQEESMDT
ncbi:hypothetical protein NP493_180g01030 [Ridgeia piscesae]|uniref:Ribosome biogenesis protein SLX9 n=1 Tax=Ridgeia piscesae TaxID=27915 RepID=A0AAD9P2U7_RIDPI|nr:hypothetical protein NP493_180g01030 [Ridgeia piscesae]